MNISIHRFFQIVIWAPAILLLSLPLLEYMSRGPQSFEDMLLTYGLSFGLLAYPVFAIWATRYMKKKSEPTIVRLIWWAPLIFIPFYGVPWVLYGLAHIVMGEMSGIAMALLWVTLSPYIIVVGYMFSMAAFVIYKLFFQPADVEH